MSRLRASLSSNVSFTSGNVENSPFEFQKKGFLQVKKFRKDALHKGSFSRPYWFVIKDSFLIWYKAKPVNGFDIYPDGCLPMGGCMMYGPWADEKHGGYVFEVANKSFNEHSLVCRTRPSDTEGIVAQSWITYLTESKVATWENSVFGDAQLIQMESIAKEKDKKNEELLKKLNENTKAAAIAANEKMLLMEKKLEEDRKLKFKLRKLKQERADIDMKMGSLKKMIQHPITHFKANKDVLAALHFIKAEISRLTPRLRQKVEAHFVLVKEFIEDFDTTAAPEV